MKLFLLISILLFSCVSTRKQMNSYLGLKDFELIERRGYPDRKEVLSSGSQVWIYQRLKQAMLTTGQFVSAYDYYIFMLDENATVYAWRTDRQPVPIQQLNVNMYIR